MHAIRVSLDGVPEPPVTGRCGECRYHLDSDPDGWAGDAVGSTRVLVTGASIAGPALVPRLKRELTAALREQGFARVMDAVGVDA